MKGAINMSEKVRIEKKDISGSEFQQANMSGTVFEDVDLSRSRVFNVNLRNAEIGAVDFGGSSFSCMNTGEGFPRKPAAFQNLELDGCTLCNCFFRNTSLVNCDLTGMTIDGIIVSDMIKVYKENQSRQK